MQLSAPAEVLAAFMSCVLSAQAAEDFADVKKARMRGDGTLELALDDITGPQPSPDVANESPRIDK